ncbi:toxin-activating lysine-acyltransferase [Pseudomonas poae]|uniref:toxin-activating lysine-acyltransferase n=1 Tax=Pseudomonas poae TaxID=200451 RepID=UPI0030E479E8
MKRTFELHARGPSSANGGSAADLGYACFIIFNSKEYSAYKITSLYRWIFRAIEHEQILLFFDKTNNPFGYITWAHLAPDTENRLLNDPNFSLHPTEWSEGGKTWIIDFSFPFGGLIEASRLARKIFQEKILNAFFGLDEIKIQPFGRLGAVN